VLFKKTKERVITLIFRYFKYLYFNRNNIKIFSINEKYRILFYTYTHAYIYIYIYIYICIYIK